MESELDDGTKDDDQNHNRRRRESADNCIRSEPPRKKRRITSLESMNVDCDAGEVKSIISSDCCSDAAHERCSKLQQKCEAQKSSIILLKQQNEKIQGEKEIVLQKLQSLQREYNLLKRERDEYKSRFEAFHRGILKQAEATGLGLSIDVDDEEKISHSARD